MNYLKIKYKLLKTKQKPVQIITFLDKMYANKIDNISIYVWKDNCVNVSIYYVKQA
jgi:hypothetical protein